MPQATAQELAEYERLDRWRTAWQWLSSKREPGRLQYRQERIEARAVRCNNAIRGLMRAFDRRNGNTFTTV